MPHPLPNRYYMLRRYEASGERVRLQWHMDDSDYTMNCFLNEDFEAYHRSKWCARDDTQTIPAMGNSNRMFM